MTFDTVAMHRDLRRQGSKQEPDLLLWLVAAALTAFSLYMFLWEYHNQNSDLYKHALIASEFVFADPHSITSRLAYPLWHMFVSAAYQLGMPLSWAAATVCALCKLAAFCLTHRILRVTLGVRVPRTALTLLTLLLMVVTPIRVPGVNNTVYLGVGSPNVWHNPTQLGVIVTALLCVPYLMHCWYAFEAALPAQGAKAVLPWRKVLALAMLLMVSLAVKPTFVQALMPAAALFFAAAWIRHPHNSRYFLQMILAFLPAAGYFVLQYLYYTGVVVPYTSGVSVGVTPLAAWEALRSMLLMAAFPLAALVAIYRRGLFRDQTLVLCLLMAGVAVLEAMFFRETGIRENHGNFNWASMSAALMLWVVITPKYVTALLDRLALIRIKRPGGWFAARMPAMLLCAALLGWHVYSSVYYVVYLLSTGSVF